MLAPKFTGRNIAEQQVQPNKLKPARVNASLKILLCGWFNDLHMRKLSIAALTFLEKQKSVQYSVLYSYVEMD